MSSCKPWCKAGFWASTNFPTTTRSVARAIHGFLWPFPNGDYLLVVTDDFSRYPEVEILRSTSAKAVIPHLDSIFARQGIPNVVRTDNGPPFNSEDFQKFATHFGFTHRRITLMWPRANGEAKRLMRTLEKAIRTAVWIVEWTKTQVHTSSDTTRSGTSRG